MIMDGGGFTELLGTLINEVMGAAFQELLYYTAGYMRFGFVLYHTNVNALPSTHYLSLIGCYLKLSISILVRSCLKEHPPELS